MKIDFKQHLKNLDGDILKEGDKELTLGMVSVGALLAPEEVDGNEKLIRFELAQKIHKGECQELSVEEAALIKKLIAKPFTTLVVGQSLKMLDGQ